MPVKTRFVNATAVEFPTGPKIYRVTGGNPAGAYWTVQKPNSLGEIYSRFEMR